MNLSCVRVLVGLAIVTFCLPSRTALLFRPNAMRLAGCHGLLASQCERLGAIPRALEVDLPCALADKPPVAPSKVSVLSNDGRSLEGVEREPLSQSQGTSEGGGEEEDEGNDASALPALLPRDSLAGPPFVTCRNWAVADARTGTLLGESGSADAVDVASTTKIMTAYLLLKLADENPNLMDEMVTFSERAAKTAGSSCGVNAGEKIAVRELLYGLLVRSGNDAAVALAEHVGKRFEPASRKASGDALSRFVAEMNRTAKRLELEATKYANPNGLPEKGHLSCARDLVRLTVEARKFPLFREIVASRRYESEVIARDGSRRTQTWKSTNRLLAIEGYTGVKTGWTNAARACLVSTGQRGRDELIVVVLGAPSANAAVADSRNLYRWAWRERGPQ